MVTLTERESQYINLYEVVWDYQQSLNEEITPTWNIINWMKALNVAWRRKDIDMFCSPYVNLLGRKVDFQKEVGEFETMKRFIESLLEENETIPKGCPKI